MVKWFKRHPNYLKDESIKLSTDSNYKELYQEREQTFLSHGNIILRLNKIYRFPVLIVYTEGTPFELPLIFPLKNELDADLVRSLSKLNLFDILKSISSSIAFYYHLRHQNASGMLCVLEWDNLDEGIQYLGITTILKRVRDWYKGVITGEFPPESLETEYIAHFNDIDTEISLLYPESFLDERLRTGEAIFTLYSFFPINVKVKGNHRIYIGSLLIGEDAHGITLPLEYEVPANLKEEGISGPLEIYSKKELLDGKIESQHLLRCFWFHLDEVPPPFESINDLVMLIGSNLFDEGLNKIYKYYDLIKTKPEYFFIGLRFANRKGELEFQLFRIWKNKKQVASLLGLNKPTDVMRYFIDSYTRVSAIGCEKLTDQTFHQRNAGRAIREKLKNRVVNIVGVGALGSEIADCVSKAGPCIMLLIDNQIMKAHNAVRHLASFNYIGMPKVIAVSEILRQHNPFVIFKEIHGDVNKFEVKDVFLDDSITISTIADDNIEALLNERLILDNKIAYYIRALRGGEGSENYTSNSW